MSEDKALLEARLNIEKEILDNVREVPDFPSKGILFKDINPIFQNSTLCNKIIDHLADYYSLQNPDVIVGIESRGFFFGFPLALKMGIPFIPIRKKGKLPGDVIEQAYDLEYGQATIEVQKGAIQKGAKVIVHDDVLATGGTALAAANLVERSGGIVTGFNFVIQLEFLKGAEKLKSSCENMYNLAHA